MSLSSFFGRGDPGGNGCGGGTATTGIYTVSLHDAVAVEG